MAGHFFFAVSSAYSVLPEGDTGATKPRPFLFS
jgi:hypothetical protein